MSGKTPGQAQHSSCFFLKASPAADPFTPKKKHEPVEPLRRQPYRRLVLIPQSQGTPQSIQDRQYDESEVNAREQFRDSHHRVDDVWPLPENVEEELPHESDSEEFGSVISGAEEEVDEVEVEDVVLPRVAPAVVREAFRSLDDVNLCTCSPNEQLLCRTSHGASEARSATLRMALEDDCSR